MNRDFKGLWVAQEILFCDDLTMVEGLFLAEIAFLDRKNECYASNAHFSELFGRTKCRCSSIIKALENKGFIRIKLTKKGKQVTRRTIFLLDDNIRQAYFKNSETEVQVDEQQHPASENETPCFGNSNTLLQKQQHPASKNETPCFENCKEEVPIEVPVEIKEPSCPGKKTSRTMDPEKQKKKYHGTEKDHALARKIYQAILLVNETVKKPNEDRWANDIRLMREQDGRTYQQIWNVFDFANRDQFWGGNILSPGSLRRHYAKLAPRAGMVKSRVRGASTVVDPVIQGKTCKQCIFVGGIKKICADPGHQACGLFRPAGSAK